LLRIIEQTQPFEIEVGTASLFEADEYDVLKFDVESNALRAFNERLSTLPNTDEHPIFRPHLAVAYIQHGTCRDLLGLPLVDSSEPAATRFLVKSVLFSGKNGDKITLFLGKPNEL
jgi:2'-5' RNA ligase